MTCDLDIHRALQVAKEATAKGRAVLHRYFGQLDQVDEKESAGLVTIADRESEKAIVEHLQGYYPDFSFLAEESHYIESSSHSSFSKSSTRGRWVIDPLDGTTNYVHGFPIFCISLALEYDGEVVLGLVDVPLLDEMYTAIQGHGAYCNERKLQVSQRTNLSDLLLATGFFSEDKAALKEQMIVFNELIYQIRGVRRAGAAAYDLCQVAAGVFDAYWEKNLKPWDVAAGLLLVREAGGRVTTYDGKEFTITDRSLVASNDQVMAAISQVIQGALKRHHASP